MECCRQSIVGQFREPPPQLEQRLVPLRPVVECGIPLRLGFGASFNSAGRRSRNAADLSIRVCYSARRDDGLRVWKSSGCAGARFPVLSESWPNQRTRRLCLILARAEEEDRDYGTEEETPEVEVTNRGPPIAVKKTAFFTSLEFWVQVAIFIFTAGFIDAGFSGDWSRIGVLSKQTEGELQMAAFGVVPLAFTLIWSMSKRKKKL